MGTLWGTPVLPGPTSWSLCTGRLIHTIRVVCASHEDYRHWLLCLQTVSRQDGGPLLLNPESFPGLQGPTQVRGSRSTLAQALGIEGWVQTWMGRERDWPPSSSPDCPGHRWCPRLTFL